MKSEIRQNGMTVLTSTDKGTINIIFRNLCGKNLFGNEYHQYLRCVAFPDMGLASGEIELVHDGEVIEKGKIPNV